MTKIKTTLYNGKVELMFQAYGHKYTVDDKKVTSVTQALNIISKPALISWAARMAVEHASKQIEPGKSYDEVQLIAIFEDAKKAHWQKKVDAGNIGTFVHNWVEDHINGKKPAIPVNKKLKDAVQRFLDWQEAHKVKFLLSEQQIYSRKYNFTGTLDFICEIDGKMYIGDLKTSKGIYYNEMGMQLAAYKFAREEEYPEEKYEGCILVRIDKEGGGIETWRFENKEDEKLFINGFLYALKLSENTEKVKKLEQSGKFRKTRP